MKRGREDGASGSAQRDLRFTSDWSDTAISSEHFWTSTAASGDFCYVHDCSKHGPRMKCSACRIVVHAVCTTNLNFPCKTTFRDVDVRLYREDTTTKHHWVHRRTQKGKCSSCSKSFQSKLSFVSKENLAISCSWCKMAYHNKDSCFYTKICEEDCLLGLHASIIVPSSWIIKLPRKGCFKSSLKKSPRRKSKGSAPSIDKLKIMDKENPSEEQEEKKDETQFWTIKPIPTVTIKPVIVFINPKSGGNQGAKLLQKFQWLLNPRQVFDLTKGGPRMGPRDRLFGLSPEVHTFNAGLLETTSDGILKAAKIGDLPALKELHRKEYSLLSIDATVQTSLHLAARYGHNNIVGYLVASAPSTILNIVDNEKRSSRGQTALHKAAERKKRATCFMLLADGANLTEKNIHGHIPKESALLAKDRELAAYHQCQEQFQLIAEEK